MNVKGIFPVQQPHFPALFIAGNSRQFTKHAKIRNGAIQILHACIFLLFLQPGKTVAVAQLVRASDCGSEGRGFEPH